MHDAEEVGTWPNCADIAHCKNGRLDADTARHIHEIIRSYQYTDVVLRDFNDPTATFFADGSSLAELKKLQRKNARTLTINAAGPDCDTVCRRIKKLIEC